MVKLPLKFRILHLIASEGNLFDHEILKTLCSEYKKERQITPSKIREHILALQTVGIINATAVDINKNGELILSISLTRYGKSRLKYLPKTHKVI